MYKLQILEALKTKFQGVSDAILNRIADKLARTVTTQEGVAPAVEGVTIQQLIESYGDSRATEAQATAVQNYEKKYGLKDGEKTTAETQSGGQPPQATQVVTPQTGGEQTPAWAQAILDSNKQLAERMSKLEMARVTSTRKTKLGEIINKLPDALRKGYERIPVDAITDEEFDTLIAEVNTEVEGIVSGTNAKGAVFGKPSAQGGQQNKNELTKEQLDAIGKREGVVAPDTQPF